jgi:hypothetical protein
MLCLCLSQEWHFTLNPKYIFLITDYVFIVFRNIDTSKMYHQNKEFNIFNHCSSFHVITIWVLHLITIWAGWNYYNSRHFLLQFRLVSYYNSRQFLLQFTAEFGCITIQGKYYNLGRLLQFRALQFCLPLLFCQMLFLCVSASSVMQK